MAITYTTLDLHNLGGLAVQSGSIADSPTWVPVVDLNGDTSCESQTSRQVDYSNEYSYCGTDLLSDLTPATFIGTGTDGTLKFAFGGTVDNTALGGTLTMQAQALAGATSIVIKGFSNNGGTVSAGTCLKIGTEIYHVFSDAAKVAGTPTTATLTIWPALEATAAADDPVTFVDKAFNSMEFNFNGDSPNTITVNSHNHPFGETAMAATLGGHVSLPNWDVSAYLPTTITSLGVPSSIPGVDQTGADGVRTCTLSFSLSHTDITGPTGKQLDGCSKDLRLDISMTGFGDPPAFTTGTTGVEYTDDGLSLTPSPEGDGWTLNGHNYIARR